MKGLAAFVSLLGWWLGSRMLACPWQPIVGVLASAGKVLPVQLCSCREVTTHTACRAVLQWTALFLHGHQQLAQPGHCSGNEVTRSLRHGEFSSVESLGKSTMGEAH